MDTSSAYDRAITYATARGTRDGDNAAGWYIQGTIGGRVSGDPVKAARYLLRGIEDGDGAVTDGFPFADLSGEWADTLTGPQLVEDTLMAAIDYLQYPDDRPERFDWFSDICDAYEAAYSTAVQDAIAKAAREILS